jgi:preprotein translocase subunit SecF
MSLTGLFVRRPVMTTLLMIGILVFGVASYRKLPVSDLPTIDYPTLNVNANLPGASPETMAATVATPLEKAFSAIAGIDEITSSSNTGGTNITLQFGLDRDVEVAAQDVNAAIGKTLPFLPSTILPPNYRKNNPNAMPVMSIAVTSNVLPMTQVDEYAQTLIAQRLSMIEGVASVGVYGSAKYAVRVQLDPKQLATRNIGVSQVANAIRQNNVMLPTGVLYGRDKTLTLNATGQMQSAAEFKRLIIAYRNGAAVRLGDVANVLDDIQNNKSVSYFNRERSVNLFVQRQPGTNTMEIAKRVKEKLDEIKPGLPPTLKANIQYDRSITIGRAVNDVKESLLVALVLVIAVIFIFLRSAVATLIPSVTLPLAIIGTFSAMYALNFSIDNLSLMALTLAVGFIVDDAIVMLENIVRHIEMGKTPMQAALDGAAEVGFTVLSMCLSLSAVFIPLMFMGGIIGRLFREFAVTISVAVLVSGFIALTLTPMLCSRLLKPHAAEEKHGRFFNFLERGFQAVLRAYERSLGWVMTHRPVTLAFSAGVLVATYFVWTNIPKGLFPPDDTGSLNASAEAPQGTPFTEMLRLGQMVSNRLATDTNIASYTMNVGSMGPSNQIQFNITLKPAGTRPPADQMVFELRRTMQTPGVDVSVTNPPSIQIGGRGGRSSYQYTLRGPDIQELYAQGERLLNRLQESPMLSSVNSNLLNPQSDPEGAHRPQQGVGDGHDTAGSRERVGERVQRAAGVDDLHADESVHGRHGDGAERADGRIGARALLRAGRGRASGSADRGRDVRDDHRAAERRALRPDDVDDDLVQPRRGCVTRRGDSGSRAHRARDAAGVDHGRVLGDGAGVSGIAEGNGDPDPDHDLHHLHHPRHSLRELHPSGDDPHRPSVRGVRRAVRAVHHARGARGVRLRRHHHADRHRGEERDHDDRLRARASAERTDSAGESDRGSSERPLPADHDDHGLGDRRHAADRDRRRHERGVAPATWCSGGGRVGVLADCHVVRDAGVLLVLR